MPFVKANETNVDFNFQLKVSLNLFQRFCKVQQIVNKIVKVFKDIIEVRKNYHLQLYRLNEIFAQIFFWISVKFSIF